MDQNMNEINNPDINPTESIENEVQNKKNSVLAYLHDLTYLLAGMLLIFLLLFRVVVVSGSSMYDTLVDGDYVLLLNNVFYSEPKQGDIIVASKSSFRDGEPIIKRVIATEGQNVIIKNGVVTVDGVVLDETYLDEGVYTAASINDEPINIVVEEGHVFCMGDHRTVSKDSRSAEIGQIDCREILGKAVILFLPVNESGKGLDFSRFGVIS